MAVIGGTGKMGRALAVALSKGNDVIIGSRDLGRAQEAAKGIQRAVGMDYADASREGDVGVVAVPASALETVAPLAEDLGGKLVISIVNPLRMEGGLLHYGREEGSAAEELARLLPKSRVATAFNNVPAAFFERGVPVPVDVLVAADTKEIFAEAARVVNSIPNLRPLYAGPLSQASIVETVTVLVLNLATLNQTGRLTTRFVSSEG